MQIHSLSVILVITMLSFEMERKGKTYYNMVASGHFEHICDEFGRDGGPTPVLLVLS